MVNLFSKRAAPACEALPPPTVRVLVLGDAAAGKSALTELLVTRKPARPARSTAGCAVSVVMWDGSAAGDAARGANGEGAGAAPPRFFVELWDVSANPYYEQLRRSLYQQINGVILVYDATDRAAPRRLAKWAGEAAAHGTFVAPLPDADAAGNLGGLPVPVLVVANKSDRLRGGGGGSSNSGGGLDSSLLNRLCGAGGGGAYQWLCDTLLRWRGAGGGGGGNGALARGGSLGGLPLSSSGPDLAGAGAGARARAVSASAAAGQIDWAAADAFFTALWARRYQPAAAAGALPFAAAGGGGGGGLEGPAPRGGMERRVDEGDRRLDDWA